MVIPKGDVLPVKSLDPKVHVAPGTSKHTAIAFFLLITLGPVLLVGFTLVTYGIGLLILLVAMITRAKKAHAQLHGSAVKVSARQFPEIHTAVQEISRALGMPQAPDSRT